MSRFVRPVRNGICLLAALAAAAPALASQIGGDVQPSVPMDAQILNPGLDTGFFNNTSFLVVPVPVSNPTIGSGAALAAAMFFKTDEQSKSSLIGGGGMYTSSGSFAAAAMTDLSFDQDRYRAKGAAGYADVIYDFYGIGNAHGSAGRFVSLEQSGGLLQGLFQMRVAKGLFIGGQFRAMNIKTTFDLPDLAGDLLDNGGPLSQLKSTITTIGLAATYDSRNKDYAPSEGVLIDAAFDAGFHSFVFDSNFFRATASYSRYDQVEHNLVLASHASFCSATGPVPLVDLCLFGYNNDLRGYAVGHYQDKAMFTVQEELRMHAFWRVGFVAFAGVGSVAPTWDQFSKLLYSVGMGARFLASEEYGVNIGLDGAVNKQGQTSWYIQIGEAF